VGRAYGGATLILDSNRSGNRAAIANEATRSGGGTRVSALLNRLFHGPAWLTFLVMGMAAGGLALCSFNLLFLFQANYNLLFTYGAMAAFDGGLLQFIELTAWGYLALACYVVVEGCLEGLLTRIRRARL
jgi:hypothetical protein